MKGSDKPKPNAIIQALAGKGKVQKLKGYVGEESRGRVALYPDLGMNICLEFDRGDLVYIMDPDEPVEPSLVFVRDEAAVTVRQETTASALAQSDLAGCTCCGEGEEDEGDGGEGAIAALIAGESGGGSGATGANCARRRAACRRRCNRNKDPFIRLGCLDSCDAAYRLCTGPIGGGGGGIIIF